MNIDYWKLLEGTLKKFGFTAYPCKRVDRATKWFVSKIGGTYAVPVYLRFVHKSKLKVLSTHVGWSDDSSHAFIVKMLQKHWIVGYEWFHQARLLDAPSVLVFNLSEELGHRYGGMPVGDSADAFEQALSGLGDFVLRENVQTVGTMRLLNLYLADTAPFAWEQCNSALRLAHIAALLVGDVDRLSEFDSCVESRFARIEADMFKLGSANEWVQALRSEVAR